MLALFASLCGSGQKNLNNCLGLSKNCLLRMILDVLSRDVVGTDVVRGSYALICQECPWIPQALLQKILKHIHSTTGRWLSLDPFVLLIVQCTRVIKKLKDDYYTPLWLPAMCWQIFENRLRKSL